MKVLITGADGQLGNSLCASVPAGIALVKTELADCDLSDQQAVAALLAKEQPDLIINTAAYTAVDKAEEEPELALQVNATAVATMANFCAANNARLIQISTDFVFDGRSDTPYPPTAATNPLSVYGQTKLEGEQAALDLCPNSCVVRSSWIYSEHGANFVKTMLRLGAERDELAVVSDQTGSPTYAANLAHMLWRLAAVDAPPRLLHWSDYGSVSWFEFAQKIFAEACELSLLAKAPEVHPTTAAEYGAPAPRPAYSVLDTSATTELLALEPTDWRTGLRSMLLKLRDKQ
jgi:dTDP-4-dehydrorhamnose reductase